MLRDSVPWKLYGHVAINMGHYILVFSGRSLNNHSYIPLHVIWMYNVYTEQWRKHVIPQRQTVPAERHSACAMAIGSDVYMFGGHLHRECRITNSLWKLAMDPKGSFDWSKIVITNKKKTPSSRAFHTGWEYAEELWTFGGLGGSPAGFLNEYGKFVHGGCNNQLLCFNPSNEEWTNPQCHGMVPEPRAYHATTINQNKVWLYGGWASGIVCHDLHELNMHSCIWTLIQTQQMQLQAHMSCTLSMISDDKLILHGGRNFGDRKFSDTWMLDLPTRTWRQYTSGTNTPRSSHTGSRGINNSVVIIGGIPGISKGDRHRHQARYKSIVHVLTEPKSLQQLAMQRICKHHTVLPWKHLPRKLRVLLDIQEIEDVCKVSVFRADLFLWCICIFMLSLLYVYDLIE